MNQLALVIATVGQPEWRRCVDTWQAKASGPFNMAIVENMELMAAYQHGFEAVSAPIVGFVHDDVLVHEQGWDKRVLAEFEAHPECAVVGFGGAPGFCDRDIYRKPYEPVQLARRGFLSNLTDAESHGSRFTSSCRVSALDGFALFVRREFLERIGGWPVGTPISYFMYDAWLCCEVRKLGLEARLVGVSSQHLNGRSTGLGMPIGREDFEAAHRWIYDNYRDVLPMDVQP